MMSKLGGERFFEKHITLSAECEMFFKNVSALYVETDTSHKSFFDIFFELSVCLGESFYIPCKALITVVCAAW